jgi:hypothetical protein
VYALSLPELYDYHSTTGLPPNLSLEDKAFVRDLQCRLSSRGISISYTTASNTFRLHRPEKNQWILDYQKRHDFEGSSKNRNGLHCLLSFPSSTIPSQPATVPAADSMEPRIFDFAGGPLSFCACEHQCLTASELLRVDGTFASLISWMESFFVS